MKEQEIHNRTPLTHQYSHTALGLENLIIAKYTDLLDLKDLVAFKVVLSIY